MYYYLNILSNVVALFICLFDSIHLLKVCYEI